MIKTLKELRQERGYSLNKVAELTGLSESGIFRIENFERRIGIKSAIALSKLYEISIVEIIKLGKS